MGTWQGHRCEGGMKVDELIPRLQGVRRTSRGYKACCPSHDDTSPSLAICDGERGVLVKCWAGCRLQDICDSLGLRPRDLFFDALNLNPQQRREAARKRAYVQQK